jgi:hypothetical protein
MFHDRFLLLTDRTHTGGFGTHGTDISLFAALRDDDFWLVVINDILMVFFFRTARPASVPWFIGMFDKDV